MSSACFLHGLQAQRPNQPHGPPAHETPHLLTPDERDVLPKPAPVKVQQPMAVPVFLPPHLGELLGLHRVSLLQAIREVVVNAGILLLQRNGQGEDLLFGEAVKGSHKLVLAQDRAAFKPAAVLRRTRGCAHWPGLDGAIELLQAGAKARPPATIYSARRRCSLWPYYPGRL